MRRIKDTAEKILVTGDFDIPAQFRHHDIVHLRTPANVAEIVRHLDGITHYIVGGPEYLDDALLSRAPGLKHVVVMGTGTNSFIDLAAAAARGIRVDNTPGINADAVAEFALGSVIFNLAAGVQSRESVLKGAWHQAPHKTLSESSVGIVGLGNIGRRIVDKVKAVSSAEVSYYSRTRDEGFEKSRDVGYKSLKDVFNSCDAVVMCVTYNPQSHHMVNGDVLKASKPGLSLFNFSNPRTVDPAALASSLKAGELRLAFFDGYYDEWTENKGLGGDRLGLLSLGPEKFVATSHIAAQSEHVLQRIITEAFRKVEAAPPPGHARAPVPGKGA